MGCGPSFDLKRIKKSSPIEILDNPDLSTSANTVKSVEVKFRQIKMKIYFRAL